MKNGKFINYIVRRYLRFDRRHPFISVSLILSLLGVVVGVSALMIAMGILNGMDGELKRKLKILDYPLTIYSNTGEISREILTKLEQNFPNFHFSPYLETTAIVLGGDEVKGIILYGVDFNRESKLNPILARELERINLKKEKSTGFGKSSGLIAESGGQPVRQKKGNQFDNQLKIGTESQISHSINQSLSRSQSSIFQPSKINSASNSQHMRTSPTNKSNVQKYPYSSYGLFDVVIGSKLFNWLGINPEEKVTFIFTRFSPIGLGVSPLFKKMRVIGKFHSGLSSYDWGISYANITGLRRILSRKGFDGIRVASPDPFRDKKRLEQFLGDGYSLVGWWQQNQNFFAALKLEKTAIFLVLMLIVLVASLNIISSLLMMVMSRRKEIALMMSLGASPQEIRAIFLRLGILVGGVGIGIGSLIGGVGLWVLSHFQIVELPKGVYGVDHLVVDLSWIDYFTIIIGTFLIVLLSSLYPAFKASRVDLLSTLRYE